MGDNKRGFLTFKYDNGIITCRFDNRLKPYLLGIKNRFHVLSRSQEWF